MKIRNGFVSNSSCSSFVVRRGEVLGKEKLVTAKQDRLLRKYGFRPVMTRSPDDVPNMTDKKAWKAEAALIKRCCSPEFKWNWGYEVTCNQDEVMVFLVENNIPFVGSCHYGQYTWIYAPELDRIIVATNVGRIMEMYGDLESWDSSKDVKVYKASEWLAKEKAFWEKVSTEKEIGK